MPKTAKTAKGRDPIRINHLQPIALTTDWAEQRQRWRQLTATMNLSDNGVILPDGQKKILLWSGPEPPHPPAAPPLDLLAESVRGREVALHAGFSGQSQFSHHFKRLVGVTPRQFRMSARIA